MSNTSELEIKNLLKQVDTMIHHKKLRWERQKQELDNRLQMKEQEFETQKSTLDQKNFEVNKVTCSSLLFDLCIDFKRIEINFKNLLD